MNSNTIEETLIQIERNLDKLESARSQVLDVTASGKEISAIMIDLVGKVQTVYQSVNYESDCFVNGLKASEKKFNEMNAEMLKELRDSSTLFHTRLSAFTNSVSDNISESITDTSNKTRVQFEEQQQIVKIYLTTLASVDDIVQEFKANIQAFNLFEQFQLIEEKTEDNRIRLASAVDEKIITLQLSISELSKTNQDLSLSIQRHNIEEFRKSNEYLSKIVQAIEYNHTNLLVRFESDQTNINLHLKSHFLSNEEFIRKNRLDDRDELNKIKDYFQNSCIRLEKSQNIKSYITWGLIGLAFISKFIFKL